MDYTTDDAKHKFYTSAAWRGVNGIRKQALKRDNFECQMCKREGKLTLDSAKIEGERKDIKLNVHHIKEIETHPQLALKLDNLETLCLFHHNLVHGKIYGRKIDGEPKRNWDDERW